MAVFLSFSLQDSDDGLAEVISNNKHGKSYTNVG